MGSFSLGVVTSVGPDRARERYKPAEGEPLPERRERTFRQLYILGGEKTALRSRSSTRSRQSLGTSWIRSDSPTHSGATATSRSTRSARQRNEFWVRNCT